MSAAREQDGVDRRERVERRSALVVVSLLSGVAWVVAVACGGTNGREGLPQPPAVDASADGPVEGGADALAADASTDAGFDATVATTDASDTFDVVIQYADRVLPDVQPPPPAPEGGAPGFPLCPPDLPAYYGDDGGVVPAFDPATAAANGASFEIAAEFVDDGGVEPAPPGSPCASQIYLGADCDQCLRSFGGGTIPAWFGINGTSALLPPCSDVWDAGVATAGPGQGQSIYSLCMDLLSCYVNSGCGAQSIAKGNTSVSACDCAGDLATCNHSGGNGPCFTQEMALFQQPGPYDGAQFFKFYQTKASVMGNLTHPGGALNTLFGTAASSCSQSCPLDGGLQLR